jgi:DNA-binding beta-propeller fold protein YncE
MMLTTVAAGRVFNHSYCIGMYGNAGAGFWDPFDFALGSNGVLYVVNRGSEELGQRITRCTVDHQFLGQFGGYGTGDGQFIWPVSLDLDQDENVYVSDAHLQRISIFDKQGTFLRQWGQPGSGDGELNSPWGLAFDQEDNLYMVDSLNSRVQKFTKDGRFLAKWGRPGNGEGEFNMPWGICVDRQGDVYVCDWKNSRVQKFSPDGEFLAQFRESDSGTGRLNRPSGVAVDAEGDVYVTDWGSHRLNIYAPNGTFITSLVGDAERPSPWAQTYIEANPDMIKARRRVNLEPEWRFRRPVAVNVDDQGRIFVLEATRHRFQVYIKEKDFEEHPLNL